jgi:uncharacterized protein (DUF362 family)
LDRVSGVQKVINEFDLSVFSGSEVALKANYNSADPFPASTHIQTLDGICSAILDQHPKKLTLAERSGMGNTADVLKRMGVLDLARERGFTAVVLDEAGRNGWQEIQSPLLTWQRGIFLGAVFAQADRIIHTCCLKTHRFGGHFTLSLKNAVGCIARRVPGLDYDFMHELHTSNHQRRLIAEISRFCRADLIIMDAIEGFSSGGPDKGRLVRPGVILATTDRVAIDAVGVALLRSYGTIPDVTNGKIFEQEQIARAAELGVGVISADRIQLESLDSHGENVAAKIQEQLDKDAPGY